MTRMLTCSSLAFASLVCLASTGYAQINWNVTYEDQTNSSGIGFDDATVDSNIHPTKSLGELRRDSIQASFGYLNTVLDGRGTVNLRFNASDTNGSGALASFGPEQLTGLPGSFQNGGVYQGARSNQRPFSGPDGDGRFDFGYGWNYAGGSVSSSNFDMVSVAIHEISHGMGFLSFTSANATGLLGNTLGTPDIFSGYDMWLQRGNGTGGGLFDTNINSATYGAFTGNPNTLTNGNNATTGLFFGGEYTREVFGSPAPLFAPSGYQSGSSTSHVNNSTAVMNPTVARNVVKRYLPYEIAMLMDFGWNVYDWDDGDGNWLVNATSVTGSNWRTDKGIVSNGSQRFNLSPAVYGSSASNPAPILSPYGQVTSNIVLNFGGSGSTGYTSTNNIGTIRLSRLNLDSSSTGTNTITGGTLNFGQNSDGSASVLAPKIVQQNSGAFIISSNIQTNNVATQVVDGVTFPGSPGLTIDGPGTGQVTLGGNITGTGSLTKAGTFTLVLNKSGGASYTGGTTITEGTLQFVVNHTFPDTGTIQLNGGTLNTGVATGRSDIAGPLQLSADSTIDLGTGNHFIRFSGLTGDPGTNTLTILDWAGTPDQSGTGGKIYFTNLTNPNTNNADFLARVRFHGFALGQATFLERLDLGSGVYELVPIPEPATVLGIAVGVLTLGRTIRRRFTKGISDGEPATTA